MRSSQDLILGIETSCDDTACAVVDTGGRVLSSVVSSQLAAHRPYGGVVPEIASREHLKNWPAVLGEALRRADRGLEAMDAVAATRAPGLIGSLLVGLSLGKALARGLERPFYGVHHLEGHLYSPFLKSADREADTPPESFVALVVSGGHSALYRVLRGEISTLAETRDDAMGEVFDKVGKRLGLPYPQGPLVDEIAEDWPDGGSAFAIARCSDGSLDFSFSGLKTESLRALDRATAGRDEMSLDDLVQIAEVREVLSGFREAAVGQVVDRLDRLYRLEPFGMLAVSGGVAANRLLRRRLPEWAGAKGVDLRLVDLALSGDNAAMIAHAAGKRLLAGDRGDSATLEAASRQPLGSR
ncbi:MAG: tRNA (adenosine(37)-N6)-threonylcarbamoyltransferase complex transferase subunit TsaD [bacterium]|nr:tRNA (adenosine(37)-N6)-threonylcarbamoyltransferase complex transferase subunit TsaD [bacterium]